MNKAVVVKKVVSTVVGFGTAKIVKGIIESNVDTESVASKVTVTAASTAIGYSLSEMTSEYTDRKIDEAIALWNKHVKKSKTAE